MILAIQDPRGREKKRCTDLPYGSTGHAFLALVFRLSVFPTRWSGRVALCRLSAPATSRPDYWYPSSQQAQPSWHAFDRGSLAGSASHNTDAKRGVEYSVQGAHHRPWPRRRIVEDELRDCGTWPQARVWQELVMPRLMPCSISKPRLLRPIKPASRFAENSIPCSLASHLTPAE